MGNPKFDPSLKTLEILEACSEAESEGLGVTEIANMTGLSRSTVHRLVAAMTDAGYLNRRNSGKKYTLGFRLLSLASHLLNHLEVKEVALPYLRSLSEYTQETVHLVQPDGKYGVYVEKVDSPQPVGLTSKVGARIMLHCTGAGKVLLAHMNETFRKSVYEQVGLPGQTANTVTSVDALEAQLVRIREQGYAFDESENRDGIYCIAGPIYNHLGEIAAAFSVSGPSYRFSREQLLSLTDKVKETTREISKELGYDVR